MILICKVESFNTHYSSYRFSNPRKGKGEFNEVRRSVTTSNPCDLIHSTHRYDDTYLGRSNITHMMSSDSQVSNDSQFGVLVDLDETS